VGIIHDARLETLVERASALTDSLLGLMTPDPSSSSSASGATTPVGAQLLASVHAAFGADPRPRVQTLIETACETTSALMEISGPTSPLLSSDMSRAFAAKAAMHRAMEFLYYLDQALTTAVAGSRVLQALRAVVDSGNEPAVYVPREGEATADDANYPLAAGIARFSGLESAGDHDLNAVQQLLLYVLNVIQSRGYRRCGDDCYETVFSPQGHATRAWRRATSLKDLVYDVTRKELNYNQWVNATRGRGNVQTVLDHLCNCADVQFPVLRRDRHLFSFRNGVYVACRSRVMDRAPPDSREDFRDAFLPYSAQSTMAALPADLAASKYFDVDFPAHLADDRHTYADIPTPHLDSILDYQRFEPEVCRWMHALLGRLMYEVGEADGWQVLPFLKGQASSGKSTILLNVCRYMYEACDVGVLSNNLERKFGMSAFSDKLLFVAPEIKSDFQMEQAEFQSMVSGEAVQLAVKHHTAKATDWRVPGIMAGNEVPGWVDNSDSIGRRVVVFEFLRKVSQGDADLGKKLQAEIPYVMLKCNRAYQDAVRECGSDNVWSHLPQYFKQTRAELREAINPMHHFMNCGKLRFDPDAYMPLEAWKRAFRAHCDENNFGKTRLVADKINAVLFEFGVTLDKSGVARCHGGHMMTAREWCMGMDFAATSDCQGGQSGMQGLRNVADAAASGGDFVFC